MSQQNSARMVWTGERLDFSGSVGSGYEFEVSAGSKKTGAGPMELVLAGVAGCTAADVVNILEKQRQKVAGVEVQITGDRADNHPRVYTRLVLKYIVRGRDIDPKAVQRAIDLSKDKYCSASAILERSGADMKTHFEIIEAE